MRFQRHDSPRLHKIIAFLQSGTFTEQRRSKNQVEGRKERERNEKRKKKKRKRNKKEILLLFLLSLPCHWCLGVEIEIQKMFSRLLGVRHLRGATVTRGGIREIPRMFLSSAHPPNPQPPVPSTTVQNLRYFMGGTAFGCAIGLVYYDVMSGHRTGADPLRDSERTAESCHEKTRAEEQNTVATVKQMAMTNVAQKREARQVQGDN